ncbi:MAG TPA: Asp-tRNA(Asn)/Glu-tRNA(Gln) amidotransferase subunit GatC [Candidatus Binataceae bacterium]|nr:Asp-tRNA(Asn)/Glu-tRNA(Gln) amidotransferase subunit GatC [Candidatus Binataceae bacterium]
MALRSAMTLERVYDIARLARLELSPEEAQAMVSDLEKILDYVEQLNQLDTSAVAPTAQVGDMLGGLREDNASNTDRAQEMLANAPAQQEQMFRVPNIIE